MNWRRCRSSPPRSAVSIGRDTDALDIPAKINGTARYGIDATVDGMVYARPKDSADTQRLERALDRRFGAPRRSKAISAVSRSKTRPIRFRAG